MVTATSLVYSPRVAAQVSAITLRVTFQFPLLPAANVSLALPWSTQNPRPETQNPKPKTQNPKPKTQNPKP